MPFVMLYILIVFVAIIFGSLSTGTHWMYRVIDMLQRNQVKYDKRFADTAFLDLQKIEDIDQLDSPRLLVTHVPWNLLPIDVLAKQCRIVHVYRNPRAVLVSYHFQVVGLALRREDYDHKDYDYNAFLMNYNDFFSDENMMYTGWFNYMDSVTFFLQCQPLHPVLAISYEDMTVDAPGTVKRLADFLDFHRSEQFYKDVIDTCSFRKQKEIEEKDALQSDMKFYRKGDMNDWKNHLTVAINDRFTELLQARAEKCQFSAKYC